MPFLGDQTTTTMSDKASTALKLGHLFGDKQHPGRNQMSMELRDLLAARAGRSEGGDPHPRQAR